jgi:hypothetical protein
MMVVMRLKVFWAAILAAGLSIPAAADGYGVPVNVNGRSAARRYFSPSRVPVNGVLFRIGPTDPVGASFDQILFQGEMPEAGVGFEAAAETAAGWSAWTPAFVKRFSHGRFWARVEFPSPASGRIKIRAINRGVRGRASIELYAIEASLKAVSSAEESGGESPGADEPAAGRPAVVGRGDWGAKPPRSGWDRHKPYRFTQHHTQGRRTNSLDESLREMRVIQDFHQNGRGWKDIGYHFLIDSAGRIFQGRPETVIGAHARGQNQGNIGISLMGNHHPPKNHTLTAAQKASIKRLGKWLMSRYGIKVGTYKGHRDYNPTDCPGDIVYGQLGRIRDSFTSPGVAAGLKVERFEPTDPAGPLAPLDGS